MKQSTGKNNKDCADDSDIMTIGDNGTPNVIYQDEDVFCIHIPKGGFASEPNVLPKDMFCFLGCHTGSFNVCLSGVTIVAKADDVVCLHPGIILRQIKFDEDCQGFALGISEHLMAAMLRRDKNIQDVLLRLYSDKMIKLDKMSSELINAYGQLLDLKLKNAHYYIKETIHSIITAVVYDLFACVRTDMTDSSDMPNRTISRGDMLFIKFSKILLEENRNERSLKYYADRLCVTPKYLSAVCHAVSGKTATCMINKVMTERIRYLLDYSDLTIKEISQQLDFPCLSFFGKYVKKHIGMSPKKYRALSDKD
ncbi:MAG: helix-turn-helix domain-containing protein [Prevotella sp.]